VTTLANTTFARSLADLGSATSARAAISPAAVRSVACGPENLDQGERADARVKLQLLQASIYKAAGAVATDADKQTAGLTLDYVSRHFGVTPYELLSWWRQAKAPTLPDEVSGETDV
jgi:hypothetical protein